MSKTIKDPGGILQRVLEAINGFRTKFGYWPKTLEADAGTIGVLAAQSLTPLGFSKLQSKLEIVIGDDLKILVKGENGDAFDYGTEGWTHEHKHSAIDWLGLGDR